MYFLKTFTFRPVTEPLSSVILKLHSSVWTVNILDLDSPPPEIVKMPAKKGKTTVQN